jgi:hypothetical protein
MARAVYSHELIDPDFAWLIASFSENNPSYRLIELVGLPLVLVYVNEESVDDVYSAYDEDPEGHQPAE